MRMQRISPGYGMNTMPFRLAVELLLVAVIGSALANGQTALPNLVIGAVLDGPGSNAPRMDQYRVEIARLLDTEYNVQFPAEKSVVSDWSPTSIDAALDNLLADPEVDVVLALGVLSSNSAARRQSLSKPVIAPHVLDPALQGVPYELRRGTPDGGDRRRIYHVSGRENLSYVTIGRDFLHELETFREVTPYDKLAVLAMKSVLTGIPGLTERFLERVQPLGVEVTMVSVEGSLEDAVARIPPDVEAVYVTPMMQYSADGLERLSRMLIQRRLPSFSLVGRREVQQGLLSGLAMGADEQRLARRTAVNLQLILDNGSAAELPVDFPRTERLTLNMATARAIDARLSWSTITEAELLYDGERPVDRKLTLGQVVREAERANLDLAAADRTVAVGQQDVRLARSSLLPQLEVSAQDVVIDRDRAASSFGTTGQNQVAGSVGLTQLLYSEQARAGYDVEQRAQEGREAERAQLRLDVVLEAAQSYLDLLGTKTAERIRRDNLELTRHNLERARTRLELGAAGPGEVYRWRSQIAQNRKDLIAAGAVRNQAEIALNRVLNRPLEESFGTVEASIDDPELALNYEVLRPYIDNRQGFAIFRQFMSSEAIDRSPELQQIDRGLEANQRLILASKRAFYVPTVAAQADVTGFKNLGVGSTNSLAEAFPPDVEFAQQNSVNWSVALSASLPLFQGGALRASRTQAEIRLDELTIQREATRQRVEQRIRSAMHATMASWAAIDLAKQSAEAARSNFDLVADGYAEGVVDIINLLDAQNQALVAELSAATAVYDFLSDLMVVQRSSGRFDFFRSPADRDDQLARMKVYFEENGYVP